MGVREVRVQEFKKLNVRFSSQSAQMMDCLKQDMGASSYNEVLKTALSLTYWAIGHVQQGGQISAVYDGKIEEKAIVPGLMAR